jgi:SAM-dependent methyltransferase
MIAQEMSDQAVRANTDQFKQVLYEYRRQTGGSTFRNHRRLQPGEAVSLNFTDQHMGRFILTYEFFAKTYRGGSILDIGTWPGDFAICLKRMGYPVDGIDLAPERFAQLFRQEGLTVHKADIEQEPWPLPEGSFQFAFFTEIIEHLRINPLRALRELNRVLVRGGRVIVSTPNMAALNYRFKFLFGNAFMQTPYAAFSKLELEGHMGHYRLLTVPELVELIERTGFSIHTVHLHTYKHVIKALYKANGHQSANPNKTQGVSRLPLKRTFRRRRLRDYPAAGWALALRLLMNAVPSFREQIIVVAEKI